jgi:hypothetical protein
MAIITKKIGNNSYAYLSVRQGRKVVHKYIGPVDNPATKKRMSAYSEINAVPERFRSLFWDTRLENINVRRNAAYIIERVLDMGSLDALEWVQWIYPVHKIIDVLTSSRALAEKSRNFWSLWFGLKNT